MLSITSMRNRKPNVSNRKVLCSECKDLGSILPLAGRDGTESQGNEGDDYIH
jgi:hypothetical protein